MCYSDFQYVALIPKAELVEEDELIAVGKRWLRKMGVRAPGDLPSAYAWVLIFNLIFWVLFL